MRKVVIIGSGPAGYTAAIYAARANLEPLLIAGAEPGGQLTLTTMVENYPGFPEGIMGPQLMEDMRGQAERFGTELLSGHVDRVDLAQSPFRIWAGDQEFESRSVIIATGSSAKLLGLPNERRLMGHGVSTCATCDGFFFRDKKIAVVGGGDSAMEESTFLTKFATDVALIHRRDEFRASKIMQDRALSNSKIRPYYNTVVEDVLGEEAVRGIRIRNIENNTTSEVDLDGVFIAIGHNPNTEIFKEQIVLDAKGYIKTEPGTTRTNVPGVFACGDVQDPVFRQAVTAAGSGCMAAIEVERFLEHRTAPEQTEPRGGPMDDAERIFTRSEANEMLPRLRPLLEDLRGEWDRVRAMNADIQKARDRSALDGYSPRGAEYVEAVSRLMLLMGQVRDMGVLVKDLDRGLVDFPYLKNDRVVYLCWHLGEQSIGYWHEMEAGFAGREPLDPHDA